MVTDPRIFQHPGLAPLWQSLEKERRQQQYAAMALLLLGLATVVVGILSRSLWWPLVGGMLATGGLWWLYRILSEQPLAAWHQQLREEPESVVWVYGMVTERMPFGLKTTAVGTLHLVEADGTLNTFVMSPAELKLVTKTLNRVLPYADFGYTEERELRYRGELTNFRGRQVL